MTGIRYPTKFTELSQAKVPSRIKPGNNNKNVQAALFLMQDTYTAYDQHRQDIRNIQEAKFDAFSVRKPVGLDRLPNSLLLQVGDAIERKIAIPTVNYWLQGANPLIASQLGKVIRDGVESVMERGGFEACLTEKPSGFRQAIDYGDFIIRIGASGEEDIPIKFDSVTLDMVYVDQNATVFNSATGVRQVTRCCVIYSYDYDQAAALYPDAKFGMGEIPSNNNYQRDFDKKWEQYSYGDNRNVQIAHYFDIGGDTPIHVVFAGTECAIIEENTGSNYQFIDGRTEKPYIPLDNFMLIPADRGFWNYGTGQLMYRYSIAKKQLRNKAVVQSMNSMNDTQVINVARDKGGEIIQRIKDGRDMSNNGQMSIIVNDTGEPIQVTKLQADQYEQSLRLLDEWLDQEVRRFGINIDAIREQKSTTATQILAEAEVEDEFISQIILRNTEFFKRMHYRTMDFIREFVSDDNDTPIWTTMMVPALDDSGRIMKNEDGSPVEEKLVVTLGDIKQLLDKYYDGIYVEVNTKTGVKERDSLKTAKGLLALRTTQDPALQAQAYKLIMDANNIPYEQTKPQQPKEGQAQEARPASQAGINEAAQALEQDKLI